MFFQGNKENNSQRFVVCNLLYQYRSNNNKKEINNKKAIIKESLKTQVNDACV